MITDKDRDIINFIYGLGFATIDHVAKMFYSKVKFSYDMARKELKKILNQSDYLKVIKNAETNQLVYIPYESKKKRISKHDILAIDYIVKLNELGVKISKVELEKDFRGIIPDIFLTFEFNNTIYNQLVEIQLRHDYVDINRFLNVIPSILEETNGFAPDIVIVQNTNHDYEKENKTPMKTILIDSYLSDIAKVLI